MTNVRKWLLAVLLAQPFYYEEIRIIHAMLPVLRQWWRLGASARTGD